MRSDPSSLLTPDLCIIGAGPAGLAVAHGAAALGVPTLVVDRDRIETALPRAGDIARHVLRDVAAEAGRGRRVEWDAVRRGAIHAAERAAAGMGATHLRALGLDVLHGTASFVDASTIDVDGRRIRARRLMVATGVRPAIPNLPGLDTVPWCGVDRWLDLPALPVRPIVLGAGRSGVAMAQALARLGCAVTLVDGASPLRGFDPELAAPVLATIRRDGVAIRGGRTVLRAEATRGGLDLVLAGADGVEERIAGDHLILATGWRPAVADLRLDRAGIRCEPTGIAVRPDGRTDVPGVYALGDVVGLGRSVEASEAQAGHVLRAALFHLRTGFDPRGVPRILHADPEIAIVGLTEAEARGRHGRIGVWRWPIAETDHARANGGTTGHLKVLTSASGRILGAGLAGSGAGAAIGPWSLAVAQGLDMRAMAGLPRAPGAWAEASRRVAIEAGLPTLRGPWIRRALWLARRFG